MASLIEIIICAILIAIILLIIIPLLSYYLYTYYIHRSNPIIHKRHYKIMIALNLLLMMSLIGDKSLYMLSIIITDNLEAAHSHILYTISDIFYFFIGPTLVLSMALLTWMLYYDISWTIITNPDNKWTHFIDPQYNGNETDLFESNWFIKNQPTLGNTKWLTKYIMFPLTTFVYITLFLSFIIHSSFHYFVFMGWMAVSILFIIIVYWNIPKQQIEVFKIKLQIDRMMRAAVSFVVFFAMYIILRILIISPQYQFILILPFQYVFALHYFIGGLLSTRYVLTECDLITSKPERSLTLTQFIGNTLRLNTLSATSNIDDNISFVSLAAILRKKISFNSFMSHLLKEFSSENLLAILECWQFKLMIADINETDKCTVDEYIGFDQLLLNKGLNEYTLPTNDDMPQSVIVYNEEMSIEQKANKLIEKYVYSLNGNCIFEVNISSQCKYKMIQKSFDLKEIEFTLQQFYDLFDEMIIELIRLLTDSHSRFLQTDDYKQLILHDAV